MMLGYFRMALRLSSITKKIRETSLFRVEVPELTYTTTREFTDAVNVSLSFVVFA